MRHFVFSGVLVILLVILQPATGLMQERTPAEVTNYKTKLITLAGMSFRGLLDACAGREGAEGVTPILLVFTGTDNAAPAGLQQQNLGVMVINAANSDKKIALPGPPGNVFHSSSALPVDGNWWVYYACQNTTSWDCNVGLVKVDQLGNVVSSRFPFISLDVPTGKRIIDVKVSSTQAEISKFIYVSVVYQDSAAPYAQSSRVFIYRQNAEGDISEQIEVPLSQGGSNVIAKTGKPAYNTYTQAVYSTLYVNKMDFQGAGNYVSVGNELYVTTLPTGTSLGGIKPRKVDSDNQTDSDTFSGGQFYFQNNQTTLTYFSSSYYYNNGSVTAIHSQYKRVDFNRKGKPLYKDPVGAGNLTFDTTPYADGVHTIYWTALDNEGNRDGIGSRFFTIHNAAGSGYAPRRGVAEEPPKKLTNTLLRAMLMRLREGTADIEQYAELKVKKLSEGDSFTNPLVVEADGKLLVYVEKVNYRMGTVTGNYVFIDQE